MSSYTPLLDQVESSVRLFSGLELVGLGVILRNELTRRGHASASNAITRGLRFYAADISGPEGPSDNGASAPGDNGAPA